MKWLESSSNTRYIESEENMKEVVRKLSVFLAVALLCTSIPLTAKMQEKASILNEEVGATELVVLYTNDVHGRAAKNMGYSGVAALKKYYIAKGASVLVLDAGDAFQGMPFASLDEGSSVVECMNRVGYDAMTPGCQDFNYGVERLLNLRGQMNFKLLGANVKNSLNGKNVLEPYTIIEKAGKKIGVFGLITPNITYKTNKDNIKNLTFQDPLTRAKEIVSQLKEKGVDYIIGLTSVGKEVAPKSIEIAKQVDGIDLIVDGHSHSPMGSGEKYGDTLLVSAGEYLNYVGIAIFKNGTVKADMVNSEQFPEKDTALDEAIAKINERQDKILSEVIGKTTVRLNADREVIRKGETAFGNMVTDAMRKVSGADIAVTNSAGICASIEVGEITKRNLITTFPYGNYVVTTKVTGQDIKDMLEHSVDNYPEPMQYFLQVSGMKFSFDSKKTVGKRVYNITIKGKKLNLKKTYVLATNNFMKNGGDQYGMLAGKAVLNEYDTLDEILADYIAKYPNTMPKIEGRITEGKKPAVKPVKKKDKKQEKTSKKKKVEKKQTKKSSKANSSKKSQKAKSKVVKKGANAAKKK